MATTRPGRGSSKPAYNSISKSYIANKIKSRSKSQEDITANIPNSTFKSYTSKYTTNGNDKSVDDSMKSYSQGSLGDCNGEKGKDNTYNDTNNKARFQFFGHITKTPSPIPGGKSYEMHLPKKSTRIPSSSVTCKENGRNSGQQQGPETNKLPPVGRTTTATRVGGGRYSTGERILHTSYPRPNRTSATGDNIRRSRSCETLQDGRPAPHDKNFPVCHRFPNCSVCTIDIKHQPQVSLVACCHLYMVYQPYV